MSRGLIVGETEFVFVERDDHMILMVTRGYKTILVELRLDEIGEIAGEFAIAHSNIIRRMKNAD